MSHSEAIAYLHTAFLGTILFGWFIVMQNQIVAIEAHWGTMIALPAPYTRFKHAFRNISHQRYVDAHRVSAGEIQCHLRESHTITLHVSLIAFAATVCTRGDPMAL